MIERRINSPTPEIKPVERIKLLEREGKLLLQLLEGIKSNREIEESQTMLMRLCRAGDKRSMTRIVDIVSELYAEALRSLPSETLEGLSKSTRITETPMRIRTLEALVAQRTKGPPIPEAK